MEHNLLAVWRDYVQTNRYEDDEATLSRRFLSSIDERLDGENSNEATLLQTILKPISRR